MAINPDGIAGALFDPHGSNLIGGLNTGIGWGTNAVYGLPVTAGMDDGDFVPVARIGHAAGTLVPAQAVGYPNKVLTIDYATAGAVPPNGLMPDGGINASGKTVDAGAACLSINTIVSPVSLFLAGEPGVHFEVYDPNTVLQRRNYLTWSEQFDNATGWALAAATVVANAIAAPDGTMTADKLAETATSATHEAGSTAAPVSPGEMNAFSTYAKAAERRYIRLDWLNANSFSAVFDLQAGVITDQSGNGASVIESVGGGWFRCSLVVAPTSATVGYRIKACIDSTVSGTSAPYLGVAGSGVYLWGASLNRGSSPAPYQRVTDWNSEYLAAAAGRCAMYQDYLGVAPVTAVEQTVGLWMDQSKGIGGAELIPDINDREFTADTGYWTKQGGVSIAGGKLIYTAVGSGLGCFRALPAAAVGRTYLVTFTIDSISAGGIRPHLGGLTSPTTRSAPGTYSEFMIPSSGGNINFIAQGTTTAVIDNVSVKEVLGFHATQSAAASRSRLSARYNLLTKTEQINDATVWLKTGTATTPNATTLLLPAENDETHQGVTGVVGATYIFSVVLSGAGTLHLAIANGGGDGPQIALTTTPTRYSFSGVAAAAALGFYVIRRPGDTATSVTMTAAQVLTSGDAAMPHPAYQRVNTATDYDTAGFIHYMRPDGADDGWYTPAIDFSGVNRMTVWVGVVKLSDATAGCIVELSQSVSTNNGSFLVDAPDVPANKDYCSYIRGTATTSAPVFAKPAPDACVFTVQGDITLALNANTNRYNGVAAATSGASAIGTGTFRNDVLYIGRRNNATLPFNGRITSITVRGTTAPTHPTVVAQMEQYAAARAGLTFTST